MQSKGSEVEEQEAEFDDVQGRLHWGGSVSYLVNNEYVASRMDAVDLGHVLTTYLSLFECKTKKGKLLKDDVNLYYRWSGE